MSTSKSIGRKRAQVLIAAHIRGLTARVKYRDTKRRYDAILYLQKMWRMWNQRLRISKKWKRCSSCCYRLRDDFFSSSQIKKGAKRVCLLPRCKDAKRSDDPNELKVVKNMFPIKQEEELLGTWRDTSSAMVLHLMAVTVETLHNQ